jgi:hypothetical protein
MKNAECKLSCNSVFFVNDAGAYIATVARALLVLLLHSAIHLDQLVLANLMRTMSLLHLTLHSISRQYHSEHTEKCIECADPITAVPGKHSGEVHKLHCCL